MGRAYHVGFSTRATASVQQIGLHSQQPAQSYIFSYNCLKKLVGEPDSESWSYDHLIKDEPLRKRASQTILVCLCLCLCLCLCASQTILCSHFTRDCIPRASLQQQSRTGGRTNTEEEKIRKHLLQKCSQAIP